MSTHSLWLAFSLLFFLKSLQQTLFFLYLLQLKEYRPDRLLEHLKRTQKTPLNAWLHLTLLAPLSLKKLPRPTPKALLLLLLSLPFLLPHFPLPLFPLPPFPFLLPISLFFSPLPPLFALALIFPLNLLVKKTIYHLASQKIKNHPRLTVIGITGSFGKSTCKHFLTQLLSSQHPTLTTPKNINTPTGISLFILKNLKSQHLFFPVELSAYQRGEIRELCRIVHPSIGILTGLGNQHLALFGSQENIIKTKAELIQFLPSNGLALINADHSIAADLKKFIHSRAYFYSTQKPLQLSLKTTKKLSHRTFFTFSLPDNTSVDLETNLTIPHHLTHLVPALYLARLFKVPWDKIKETLLQMKIPESALQSQKHSSGATFFLDLKNSTPEGVLAALDELGRQKTRHKIAVLPCLIELGSQAPEIHRKIGKSLAKNSTLSIISSPDYFTFIRQEAKNISLTQLSHPAAIISTLKPYLNHSSTFLFEGKLPFQPLKDL